MCSREGESVDVPDTVPAFLRKLWRMVEDPQTDHLIHWGEDGKSFIIEDALDLVTVLPLWYKHCNMASFIRQLNTYGFRKVTSLDNGLTSINTKEYTHPNFVRAFPSLMEGIVRRFGIVKSQGQRAGTMHTVMAQLEEASSGQAVLAAQLETMRTKHVQLVNELDVLRKEVLGRPSPGSAHARWMNAGRTAAGSSASAVSEGREELARLAAREARTRLALVDERRKWLLREHLLRVQELELRVCAEKVRADREAAEWSLRMKSLDQKLANLRLRNDILRQELLLSLKQC